MFYHLELTRFLDLPPKYFGPRLGEIIEEKLTQEVEGTCSGKHGYIIAVLRILEKKQGLIRMDGTGLATFEVKFNCVTFRPFKGEVIDCVVQSVNKMGFFAEAGPLQVFVSNHLIPDEYEFVSSGDPQYVSNDQSVSIHEGSEVRLRIVGHRMDAREIFCIGTIKEEFLGPIN